MTAKASNDEAALAFSFPKDLGNCQGALKAKLNRVHRVGGNKYKHTFRVSERLSSNRMPGHKSIDELKEEPWDW